jgi:hypothetical protein
MSDLPSVQQQASSSNSSNRNPQVGIKRYCCGCTSRTSTIIAASFLLLGGCLYLVVGIFALSDHTSANAPTEDERVMLQMLIPAMVLQITFSSLAIWGACTYRGWPVRCCRLWMSILLALNFAGMIISVNPFMLVGLLLQFVLFWMPMYGYGLDYETLKAASREYEVSPLPVVVKDEDQALDGYTDHDRLGQGFDDDDDEKEYGVELV